MPPLTRPGIILIPLSVLSLCDRTGNVDTVWDCVWRCHWRTIVQEQEQNARTEYLDHRSFPSGLLVIELDLYGNPRPIRVFVPLECFVVLLDCMRTSMSYSHPARQNHTILNPRPRSHPASTTQAHSRILSRLRWCGREWVPILYNHIYILLFTRRLSLPRPW